MNHMPTRIFLYGVPKRDRSAIEVLLRHDDRSAVIVDDPSHADVSVIDLDGPAHQEVWEQALREFDGPRIVTSVRERDYANPDKYIRKPCHSSQLLEAIHKLAERFPEIDDELIARGAPVSAVETCATDDAGEARVNRKRDTVELESIPVAEIRETVSPAPAGPFSAIRALSPGVDEDDGIPTLTVRESLPPEFPAEDPAESTAEREEGLPDAAEAPDKMAEIHFLDVEPARAGGEVSGGPDHTVEVEAPAFVASESDADESFYAPEKTLQGIVARAWEMAVERNMPLEICELGEPLILCPRREVVLTTFTDEHLESLSQLPMDVEEVEVSWVDPFMVDSIMSRSEDRPVSYDHFLWKITLLCSRGRLPQGVSKTEPVELQKGREIEPPPFPDAREMMALWEQGTVSLAETVDRTGLSVGEVSGFFSAMHALGLASVPDRRRRGLLGRLFHKSA